jgi:hypothetical protein
MHPELLAALAEQRRREIQAEFARTRLGRRIVRRTVARLLRSAGDRLFRIGVALDLDEAHA